MKKTLLITGALAILFLSACADTEQATQTDNETTKAVQTQDADLNPENAETTAAARSEADTAAFNGALQLLDETFCDKITDASYKAECKTTVADQKNYNDAINSQDKSLCDKISNKDKGAACKIAIDVDAQLAEKQEKFIENLNANNDLKETIINGGIIGDCKKLNDDQLAIDCERDILIRKAADSKTLEECDKASSNDIKDACYFYVEKML